MYTTESMNNLKCPQCKDKHVRPKLLPCGSLLCNYFYTITIFEYPCKFKCVACRKIHYVPKLGFPSDENLSKLSTEEATLKSKLENIQEKISIDKFNLINAEYVIKSYCQELKEQITLIKELEIEKLNQLLDKMALKIDDFEKMKLKAYPNTNKIKNSKINKEIDQFSLKMTKISEELDSSKKLPYFDHDLQERLKNDHKSIQKILMDEFIENIDMDFYKYIDQTVSKSLNIRNLFDNF